GGTTFTTSGAYTQPTGLTSLQGGTLSADGGVNLQGGVINGWGIIRGDVVNSGEIDLGGAGVTGILFIQGNYTQTGAGVLNLKIGGAGEGDYDQLQITGQAVLEEGAALDVSLVNDFIPAIDDSFAVVSFDTLEGQFTILNLPEFTGGRLD